MNLVWSTAIPLSTNNLQRAMPWRVQTGILNTGIVKVGICRLCQYDSQAGKYNFLVVLFFPYFLAFVGGASTFLFLSLMCIVQFLFSYFYIPETKGISLEKIEELWRQWNVFLFSLFSISKIQVFVIHLNMNLKRTNSNQCLFELQKINNWTGTWLC